MLDKIKNITAFCIDKYAWLLSLVLKINIVRLNKEKYTRKVVRRFYRDNEEAIYAKAMELSLSDVLTDEQKQRQYKSLKWFFGSLIFIVSFISCFPESILGIVIPCAIDITFFQACLYMAMQRILLLYGTSEDEHADQTESGMVTFVRPVQLSKAPSPIFVTESGMVTLVRPVQPSNLYLIVIQIIAI